MKRILALLALSALPAFGNTPCAPVTGPPVWVKCAVSYSTRGLNVPGENPLVYDLYSPTDPAVGGNGYPYVLWGNGGGYGGASLLSPNGNNSGAAAWTALAQNGYGWAPHANVIVYYVTVQTQAVLSAGYTGGATSVNVATTLGQFWPTGSWSGTATFVSPTNTNSNQVTVTAQSGSSFPYTLTIPAGAPAGNAAGDYVIVNAATLQKPINDFAELLAYLGHNPNSVNAVGNPHQIYLFDLSAGTSYPMANLIGDNAFNAGNSDYTLSNYHNAHIQGVVPLSSLYDLGCSSVSHGFRGGVAFTANVALATSVGQTIGTACNVVGPNAAYTADLGWSPVACLPGSVSCSWGTPALIPAPIYFIDGATDAVISPYPAYEFVNLATTNNQLFLIAGHLVEAGQGHGGDLNSGAGGIISQASATWTTAMGFFFAPKTTGSVVSVGAGGGGAM
jgi:hypothetical protein